ncbi:MAG TPA: glutathione S-transferase N-terminal domain-containing protein [Miltoncostaeaceae bacterium]|nr:glutathione S-transferase N-terminal domain-containing protein [Miltoncostaeaceae bacterium]
MMQLFQAEWCPFSQRVRQRLTELGIDYVARQVAPTPPERDTMREEVGDDTIPVLVLDDGRVLRETDEILDHLAGLDAPGAEGHRRQALAHGMSQLP